MQEQMARLYQAMRVARKITDRAPRTELAQRLGVSKQLVYHWEHRGPSKAALALAQSKYGISAAWVMSGEGTIFVNRAHKIVWPFSRINPRDLTKLAPADIAFVEVIVQNAIQTIKAKGKIRQGLTTRRSK